MSDDERAYLRTQDFSEVRRSFLAVIKKRGKPPKDRSKYFIDGAVCVDFFIQYERLAEDVAELCRRLNICRDVSEMKRLKSNYRFNKAHFSEYYDQDAEKLVARNYAWEIDRFGYRCRLR